MSIAVNPITSYYTNGIAANGTTNNNGVALYEQYLAIQAAEDADALALELSSGSGSGSSTATSDASSLGSADLLNLSPAALNILNGIDNNTDTVGTTSTLTITGGTSNQVAALAQQAQVAAIVSQYANQPLTQATFTQIENALTAAGINPEQVSIQQLLEAYSYAYTPGLPFNGQLFTDTLASELDNA